MKLKDFNFHDALLKTIIIERHNPGYHDEIRIKVSFSDASEVSILFEECFQANLKLNFGVIAEETIYDLYESEEEEEMLLLKEKWSKIGGDVEGLKFFCIETNSTNSLIKIFAKSYQIHLLESI